MAGDVTDITVTILTDIRDEIRRTNAKVDGLTTELKAEMAELRTEMRDGFKAVREELQAIDGIVTLLEKRDREAVEELRKDVRMLKERALRMGG